jgi:L-threonylcarbamoyladenylate synthase
MPPVVACAAGGMHNSLSRHCLREPALSKTADVVDAHKPRNIEAAAAILRAGGLVAFPTETVYGLGADALNPPAVARIFEVKKRPQFDPVIVHVADAEEAGRYGSLDSEAAKELIRRFWPGPLTLVVPRSELIPPIVTAGLDTVGIRMPAHPAALALIRALGRPIAAPSANPFGYVSPTEARHVSEQLGAQVDLILDGGRCRVGIESTVLSLADPVPRILRAGGVTAEEIAQVVGRVEYAPHAAGTPRAPGQLQRHYATNTPLEIIARPDDARAVAGERVGLLALKAPGERSGWAAVEILSETGDLREAAANLFGALRRLDRIGLDRILALALPEEGLGMAIMDRLRRCAARPPAGPPTGAA